MQLAWLQLEFAMVHPGVQSANLGTVPETDIESGESYITITGCCFQLYVRFLFKRHFTCSINLCFIFLLCFTRISYIIFFSCCWFTVAWKNMKISLSLFTQTSTVAQFISYLPTSQSTWAVGCRGCCSDMALVLAVKWSICRYVCLHHRHPLAHSLLHSPDERKRLIYSGFKGTA